MRPPTNCRSNSAERPVDSCSEVSEVDWPLASKRVFVGRLPDDCFGRDLSELFG
jgi:hypothetical protein